MKTAIEKLREEFEKETGIKADVKNGLYHFMFSDAYVDWLETRLLSRPEETKQEGEVAEAVKILTTAIKADSGLWQSYKANIAMAFKDEWNRAIEDVSFIDVRRLNESVHDIANDAADNFLKLWCSTPPSPSQPEQERWDALDLSKAVKDDSGTSYKAFPLPSETKQGEKEEEQDFLDWPYEGICGKCSSPVLKLNRDYLCEGCISMGVTMLPNFSQEGIQSVMKFVRLRAKSATSSVSHQGTILHGKEGEGMDTNTHIEITRHLQKYFCLDKFANENPNLVMPLIKAVYEYAALAVKWPEDSKESLLDAMQEGAELWKQEYIDCRRHLQSLVDLKKYKEQNGKDSEYLKNRPIIWKNAEVFLIKFQHLT